MFKEPKETIEQRTNKTQENLKIEMEKLQTEIIEQKYLVDKNEKLTGRPPRQNQ